MIAGAVRLPIADLARTEPGLPVAVAGRVTSVVSNEWRIEDVTGAVLAHPERPEDASAIALGAWVFAEATWTGTVLDEARLSEVHSPETPFPRMSGEWVRLHRDGRRRLRMLSTRAAVLRSVRRFFDEREFLEVETPLAVPSPGLDLHLDAFSVGHAKTERWLITSPEYQMKRLLAGGLERIYQICRCFRRGEVGTHHQPEFTMLEWYRALEDSDALMRDTESLVAAAAMDVLGTTCLRTEGHAPLELGPPWERLRIDEAFERYAGVSMDSVLPDEDRFFLTLTEQIEPQLGRTRPVFLTHWPASMASLARVLPGPPPRADRFEAYVRGVELCNGFGELVDATEQRRRLMADQQARQSKNMPVYPLDERFLSALEEGVPPSSGNALGIDRLVMLLSGATDIDDVVTFSDARL